MGSDFETWDALTGAMYMGAGTIWEHIWLWLSVIMCVVALWMGNSHESDAYERMEDNK